MTPNKIKPCPMCGGEAEIFTEGELGICLYGVRCCDIYCGVHTKHWDTFGYAVDHWNKRKEITPVDNEPITNLKPIIGGPYTVGIDNEPTAEECLEWFQNKAGVYSIDKVKADNKNRFFVRGEVKRYMTTLGEGKTPLEAIQEAMKNEKENKNG